MEAPPRANLPRALLHPTDLRVLLVYGSVVALVRGCSAVAPHPRTSATPSTRTLKREGQVSRVEQQEAFQERKSKKQKHKTATAIVGRGGLHRMGVVGLAVELWR